VSSLRARLLTRRWREGVRDLVLRATARDDLAGYRADLARRYLRGEGIEIGALHRPVRLPRAAHVRYVDVMTREELLSTYSPAVYGDPRWVVKTDVVDDCERLARFPDGSLDFVIANHTLEHVEDTVAGLESLVRVLRPGGVLFLALPDARRTFDASRARTTVEHVLADHREGPERSRELHYREWAAVECLPEDRVPERVAQFRAEGARHHFHVWELEGFLDLLQTLELPVTLELAETHLDEFVVILRRSSSSDDGLGRAD
jgi:SAM-dependent methyltransferase